MVREVITYDSEGGKKADKYLRELSLKLGHGASVSVGFLNGATYPVEDGGLPVAQVAFWNEFGTKHSPPRPFFRNMVEEQSPTWAMKLGAAVRYAGYRSKTALEIVAADIAGHLRESIQLLEDPPNALSTVERKGQPKPLMDTKWMWRNVGWVVTNGKPTK